MIAIGDKLDNKYRVVKVLGAGGFGGVFLADDEEIPGRPVAIKVLLRPNDEQHSNLVKEMRTLSQFQHPHVVAFYHHFRDENRLYLVMEFCPGGSLYDRLRSTGHFADEQVFAWGQDLCETLAFVHGKQIVHHDIKPMNVLFHADGTIKIGDFGIANGDAGTRVYLPPEWFLGERSVRLDPRVDVYALGITLLELLTGKNPFVGLTQDEAILARIEHNFIPKELPRWVQEVLLRATHPTPNLHRYWESNDVRTHYTGNDCRWGRGGDGSVPHQPRTGARDTEAAHPRSKDEFGTRDRRRATDQIAPTARRCLREPERHDRIASAGSHEQNPRHRPVPEHLPPRDGAAKFLDGGPRRLRPSRARFLPR